MEYRKAKGVKEQYNSLEELRKAWGCRELGKRRTRDLDKLEAQRAAFCSHHICTGCQKPMTYVGGNQMACTNPDCRGIKIERTLADGTKVVNYEVAYDLLDEKYAEVAYNLFD